MRNPLILFALVLITSVSASSPSNAADHNTEFHLDWRFAKDFIEGAEQESFDDSKWKKVGLPHDWAIEGPFDSKYNARNGGLPIRGSGWYRKHFTLSANQTGKRVAIEFDGVMDNARVWVNGTYVGERPYGYIGFEFDITPHVKFGQENVIAVNAHPRDLSTRWYSGAGIYRNVRLKLNHPVHIPQWGTYIHTPTVTESTAEVAIKTELKNAQTQATKGNLITEIRDPSGNSVATLSASFSIDEAATATINQTVTLPNPKLWDVGQGHLYTAVSQVRVGEELVDEYETKFGVRTLKFDADKGFFLNGNLVELNGVCMHHDQGPLGAAINYRAKQRQMQIMQSMGVNALRTSHNPPSPEMLRVCDELGILVIDEAFDEWKMGKVPNGYSNHFDEWHERDLRDLIRRDRNHPAVILWSIGNEILEQGRPDGWKLAKHLSDICHDEDPTRLTTAGFNYYPAPFKNKLAFQIDVVGMNYWPLSYAKIKKDYPELIIYGSETSSQTSSRGVYHLPISAQPQKETKQVSSYDVIVGPPWAYAPDAEFDVQEANEFSLGEFIWTGFDYLGEPTPYGGRDNSTDGYWNADWPARSSYFAPVDLCGFPKDRYYLYQSQWTTEPMVHVLPHWNWPDKLDEKIPVFAYTNCEEVELIVNGKSLGRKIKGQDTTDIPAQFYYYNKKTYTTKYRLSWEVPYAPGSLKVIGYNNGKAVAEKTIHTAREPAKLNLSVDRAVIDADDRDLSFITVKITDAAGNLCPLADNQVDFKIEGPATLAAVGNGNATSLESFRVPYRKAFNGMCLLVVQSTKDAGQIKITASSAGLETSEVSIESR